MTESPVGGGNPTGKKWRSLINATTRERKRSRRRRGERVAKGNGSYSGDYGVNPSLATDREEVCIHKPPREVCGGRFTDTTRLPAYGLK